MSSNLETIAVFFFIYMLIGGDLLGFPILLYLLWTPFFFLPFVYLGWMLYFDRLTPYQGGRQVPFIRRLSFWNYMANYFPMKLHKSVDLDPSKNYMFCFHPHGVLCISAFVNFCTEATGWTQKFGIPIHLLTMDVFFYMPLFREGAMACGLTSVQEDSISYKLTKLGQGHSVAIVAGGVAEANLTEMEHPYRVRVNNRRGFIRVALKTGSPLVPVFSFGETEILHQLKAAPGSLLKRCQIWSHKIFRFAPMKFCSEGGSMLPFRKPINTVVGAPLEVPQIANPTEEEIDYWHAKYVDSLRQVFEDNKEKYATPNKDLEIF